MEIISSKSEVRLTEFLAKIEAKPDIWMCVHINTASLNEAAIDTEGLSKAVLEKIELVSNQITTKLLALGLRDLEGQIYLCEDSDVVAVYSTKDSQSDNVLKKINTEFSVPEFKNNFHIYPMKEKLKAVIQLSQEKKKSAKVFVEKKKNLAKVQEKFEDFKEDAELTRSIQLMRLKRPNGKILVIEDDIITRGLIVAALQKDYRVIQAKDGESGLSSYVVYAPNIVILDIHLPDRSGIEILDRIKLIDPQAYVIMLSADSIADNVKASKAKGATDFIRKPFSKERLIQLITKCPTLGPKATARALGWITLSQGDL